MSDFWVRRDPITAGLHPIDEASFDAFSRLPLRADLHVEVKLPRNGRHHRLYWALCHRIADALGLDSETVSDVLKIATGHATVVRSKTHGLLHLPKSISFANMDQTAFREFFERCVVCICEEWGIERKDVLAAVEDLLVPTERRRA